MESFGVLIKKLNDALAKRANNEVRAEGLTFTQMGVLVYLDGERGKSAAMHDIEVHFAVSQPTVVGITHRLLEKKMVRIAQDPTHPRGKRVWLTPLGQRKCAIAYAHMEETETALLSHLNGEERAEFWRLLEKAIEGVTEKQ